MASESRKIKFASFSRWQAFYWLTFQIFALFVIVKISSDAYF
jgi:hypothetical protein